jgi:hypothetical protein
MSEKIFYKNLGRSSEFENSNMSRIFCTIALKIQRSWRIGSNGSLFGCILASLYKPKGNKSFF